MSRYLLFLSLLTLPCLLACTRSNPGASLNGPPGVDETAEPPLKYTLQIGDKSVPITEGETIRVDGSFNDPDVTLTAQSFRVFPYRGVSFHYPRSFTFEADLSEADNKSWTLSGNDFKIMFFVMQGSLTTEQFAREMTDQFGRKNCQVTQATPLKFADQSLSGTTLKAKLLASNLVVDIYRLPGSGSTTRLLVLQDSLDDAGNRTSEAQAALQLLSESAQLER